ncbi:MAG: hypothetical protein U0802_24415 [Candidatus Binatia bacterium]
MYVRNELFNHPPFMIHFLRALSALARWTGAPFPFCLRLPGILADVGTVAIVWRLRDRLESGASASRRHRAPRPRAGRADDQRLSRQHRLADDLLRRAGGAPRRTARRRVAGGRRARHGDVREDPRRHLPADRRPVAAPLAAPRGALGAVAATVGVASMPYLRGHVSIIAQHVLAYRGGATPWGWPLLAELARTRRRSCS